LRSTRPGAVQSRTDEHYPVLVEAIAGIVEPGETDLSGVRARASEEALEEAGVRVAPEAFVILGHGAFDAPGIMAEKVFFAAALYDPTQRGEPKTDGSPFEERGSVFELSLEEAFARIDAGLLCDMKTELGLRRLAAWLTRTH
jgi:ADP-ribose pyrophosphatase